MKNNIGKKHYIASGINIFDQSKKDAKPHICFYCHKKTRGAIHFFSIILKRWMWSCGDCHALIRGVYRPRFLRHRKMVRT